MKSKSWSWHMWAAKTSSLPRPVERSSSERLPKCNEVTEPETTMGTNGQSIEIEDQYLYECLKPRWLTSKNWACFIANPSRKISAPNLIVSTSMIYYLWIPHLYIPLLFAFQSFSHSSPTPKCCGTSRLKSSWFELPQDLHPRNLHSWHPHCFAENALCTWCSCWGSPR